MIPRFPGRCVAESSASTLMSRPGASGCASSQVGLRAVLDEEGLFDFGPLPPAHYTIETVVPEWGAWSAPIELRARADVEIVVEVGVGSGGA